MAPDAIVGALRARILREPRFGFLVVGRVDLLDARLARFVQLLQPDIVLLHGAIFARALRHRKLDVLHVRIMAHVLRDDRLAGSRAPFLVLNQVPVPLREAFGLRIFGLRKLRVRIVGVRRRLFTWSAWPGLMLLRLSRCNCETNREREDADRARAQPHGEAIQALRLSRQCQEMANCRFW